MSCPGALLCSEDFCCNSGFPRSQPGKFELTVPNAAPACLLMLLVKPWQKHSPSGLQKSCRIRCLPTRWALLRDVTPLTTSDSSLTPFPALLRTLRARQQPELRAEGRQEPAVPPPAPRARSRGSASAWAPAPQICFVLLTCPPPPTSFFLLEAPSCTHVCAMNRHPQRRSLEVAGDTLIPLYERVFPYVWLNVRFFRYALYSS